MLSANIGLLLDPFSVNVITKACVYHVYMTVYIMLSLYFTKPLIINDNTNIIINYKRYSLWKSATLLHLFICFSRQEIIQVEDLSCSHTVNDQSFHKGLPLSSMYELVRDVFLLIRIAFSFHLGKVWLLLLQGNLM